MRNPGCYFAFLPLLSLASIAGVGYPVSAQLGEKDVLEAGFDLDGPATGLLRITVAPFIEIDGKLLDASGQPVPGEALLAIASGEAIDTGGMAFTGPDGTFRLMLLKAGAYHIYLAGDEDNWEDPDNQKKHAGDFPLLTVAGQANPSVTLTVAAQQ